MNSLFLVPSFACVRNKNKFFLKQKLLIDYKMSQFRSSFSCWQLWQIAPTKHCSLAPDINEEKLKKAGKCTANYSPAISQRLVLLSLATFVVDSGSFVNARDYKWFHFVRGKRGLIRSLWRLNVEWDVIIPFIWTANEEYLLNTSGCYFYSALRR